ncbi:MAG: hypothetical protein WAK20_08100 [Candidatus Acidiferrum sp.]
MQCKEFSSLLEHQGLSPLSEAAQDHLAACAACQDFLADLGSIIAVARELPAELEPPQRIWVSLRSQLETEGLIKEPATAETRQSPRWLDRMRALFTPRLLATAGVGVSLAIAAFMQYHRPSAPAIPEIAAQIATHPTQPGSAGPESNEARVSPPAPAPRVTPTVPGAQLAAASKTRQPRPVIARPLSEAAGASSPSQNIQIADQVGGIGQDGHGMSNPELDEALRTNLRTVNEFIAECEARLKKYPNDTLAREYLESAKQQKQELIGAILDSGRSEQ